MARSLCAVCLLIFSVLYGIAQQCPCFNNATFEGPPAADTAPPQWINCGVTPDTQPGQYGINDPPSQGSTYMGLAASYLSFDILGTPYTDEPWEGGSQQLCSPLAAGTPYRFTIDLAMTYNVSNPSEPVNAPGDVQIWGGSSSCQETELLWSQRIDHLDWKTYCVEFTPSAGHTYIMIRAKYTGTPNGQQLDSIFYLRVDNIQCAGGSCSPPPPGNCPVCMQNGNFETGSFCQQNVVNATGWGMCGQTPDDQPCAGPLGYGTTYPSNTPPYEGNWYVGMAAAPVAGPTGFEGVTQLLCAPFNSGQLYSISLAGAYSTEGSYSAPGTIEVWCGNGSCAEGELLFTANVTTTSWQLYSGTFTPSASCGWITIRARCPNCTGFDATYLLVDAIEITTTDCPTGPTVTLSASPDSICAGSCADVTATAAGGTPPYTYAWSPSIGTTAGPLNVCPTVTTTYRVTVTDSNGDSDTASVTVTVNSPPALTTSVVNPTCNGLCDGTATVTATGTSPFTYLWDNAATSQTTATATGLCVGNYNVTVTDSNGCVSTTSVTLTAPPAMTLTTSKVDLLCNGVCNGSATVTASGGTTPYSYSWSAGGQTNQTATGLCAGSYSVTVTDANGCTNTASVTITEPPVLSVTTSAINASCNGACDGSATVTASGGTTPYTYNWSAGGSGSTQTGLCAGTYTVTVTDANGCISTASVTITQPPAIVLSTSSLDADCGVQNGSATVTASGGTGGFTYSWNDASSQTSATATGVGVGSYTVTVTDANGCTADTTVIVNEVGGFPVTISKTDVTCNGACDGTATATPTGGNSPYSYQWDAGAGSQTTQTATGLCPGAYGVTMTDNTGCSGSQSVTITEPPALSATETHVNVTCNGGSDGSVDVSVSGGTSPYTYLWDNGATSEDLSNLPTSNFQLTVTDVNGCTAVVAVTVTEPSPINLQLSTSNSTCGSANGTATVNITGGGVSPFTYRWNDANSQSTPMATGLAAGAYTVTVTDNNGCTATGSTTINDQGAPSAQISSSANVSCSGVCDGSATATATGGATPYRWTWNNGTTSFTASGLCAGTHTVTVTDSSSCQATATVIVTEPPAITLTTGGTDESCSQSNGSATVTATGGTGAYTYNWSPSGQTTATASGLAAGTHCVTVTDANNCSRDTCVTITNIAGPVASLSATNVCLGTATPFTYLSTGSITTCLWDFGDGNGSATCGSVTHTYGSAGAYTVLHCVSDNAGCQSCDSISVTVSPIPVACFGDSLKGCVPVTANFTNCSTGGATYAWDFGDGGTSDQQNPAHTFTGAGCRDIRLTVTSAAGCTATRKKDCYVEGYAWPKADFDLTPRELTILNPTVNFFDKSANATALYWNFGDNTTDTVNLNPTHTYQDTGCYDVTLIRVNQQGCADTVQKDICVKDIYTLYIPTAFSPNLDGSNDRFMPVYYGICEFEMYIFDRWGNLIYETTSLQGWDGTANGGSEVVQEDVYVWMVKAKDCSGKEINKSGHVTVIK